MSQNRQPKGIPAGGEFAAHDREDGNVTLARPHAHETPAEVDTQLVEHLEAASLARGLIDSLQRRIESYREANADYYARSIAHCEAQLEEAEAALAAAESAAAPMELEYVVRGGWPRFFLVTNAGGHVHSSMACTTCYPTTRFAWLPDLSGSDEQAVIDAAGDGACTVCFPNAPVAEPSRPRPNTIESPAQRASRQEREAKRAAAEAKRQATGISTPDGKPLLGLSRVGRDGDARPGYEIKTERTAQIEAVAALADERWSDRYNEGQPDTPYRTTLRIEVEAFVNRTVEALAHKRSQSVEEVRAEIDKKVAAKLKRDGF